MTINYQKEIDLFHKLWVETIIEANDDISKIVFMHLLENVTYFGELILEKKDYSRLKVMRTLELTYAHSLQQIQNRIKELES